MTSPSIAFNYRLEVPASSVGTSAPTTIEESGWKDLALDLATWDLDMFDPANPVFGPWLITGADAIAQRVAIRFKFWLGEWFLDTRQGVPYLQTVLVPNPDLTLIRTLFRRVIKTTPGVKHVGSLDMRWEKAERRLIVDAFTATLVDGSELVMESPFIVFQK